MSEKAQIKSYENEFVVLPLPFDSLHDSSGEYDKENLVKGIEKSKIIDLIVNFALLLFRYTYKTAIPIGIVESNRNWNVIIDSDNMTFNELKAKICRKRNNNVNCANQYKIVIFNDNQKNNMFEQFPNLLLGLIINSNNTGTTDIEILYKKSLFFKDTIKALRNNFLFLIKQTDQSPNENIAYYDIVSLGEKKKLEAFNKKGKDYNPNMTYVECFYKHVKGNFGRIALFDQEKQITYEELNNISNYYAEKIRKNNKKHIAIYTKNDLATAIGILSILKAGKTIVAINPAYPPNRIKSIVNDLDIEIILTCEQTDKFISDINVVKFPLLVDVYQKLKKKYKDVYQEVRLEDICYVIYTSGTTGIPKGVKITQKNIMIEINFFKEYFNIDEKMKFLHTLNYSFDFGFYDLLSGMLYGGCLYCLNRKKLKSLKDYIYFILDHGINFLNTTPSFFNILASFKVMLPSLRHVHLGGEKVTYEMIKKYTGITEPKCNIYNGYGPCECTVGSNIYKILPEDKYGDIHRYASVPIGKPTDNSLVYVLDDKLQTVPINCLGELVIAGESVGSGYVNEENNQGKFIILQDVGIKAYRTGDLVRWLNSGDIEFIGRIDNQIKVNGFRIELSEIDSVLMNHENITEAKTIYCNNKIISYIKQSKKMNENSIKKYLQNYLPFYMIPVKIIVLKEFPYLASKKIDVKKLIEMQERD